MRVFFLRVVLLASVLIHCNVYGQTHRKPVLLNMNSFNLETNNSRYQSCINMMQLTGLPYDTTSSIDTALQYPVIITASRIIDTALNLAQRTQFINYVNSGGILITSSLRDTALFPLFGVNTSESDDSLLSITFDTLSHPQYFDLVNDSLEVTVSIGDSSFTNFFTRAYQPTTAQVLATYEDGRCALAMNTYGSGKTYLFGPDFRDIVLRPQLNMDLEAQRVYSNGFEVSTDVFVFVLRNMIRQHIPNSVYKYTSPGNSSSALLLTHDVDSYSSIDTMGRFSVFEEARGISAQYNITTRYMSDTWMSAYYTGNENRVDSLLMHGHVLASHSVGHFPDFNEDEVFPYGTLGNSMISYTPAYTSGETSNGTVLGELEVSKDILEVTYGVPIRSFRAGHLCYPDSLIMGLAATNYEFNSTNSANDVLTGFPFYPNVERSFSSPVSTVLEIPMTISDVFKDDPIADTNKTLKVHIWRDQITKYDQNNAPVTLLIHPNRKFKLEAMKNLLDSIPSSMVIFPFQKYGEYWRKRDSLQFHTNLVNDTLYVMMDNDKLVMDQSFVLDHIGLDTVVFKDYDGSPLYFTSLPFSSTQRLYYRQSYLAGITGASPQELASMVLYPNPTNSIIYLKFDQHLTNPAYVSVFDITGKLKSNYTITNGGVQKLVLNETLAGGVYFIRTAVNDKLYLNKVVLVK